MLSLALEDRGFVDIEANKKRMIISNELKLRGDRSANKKEESLATLELLFELID